MSAEYYLREIGYPAMAIPWRAQQLRYTAFLIQPPLDIDFNQLWLEATGSEPDDVNSQPKRQLQVFVQNNEAYRAVLQIERDRIDLVFQPVESLPPIGIFELGPFQQMREVFKDFVYQYLDVDTWPIANRVAFGTVLSTETPDVKAARQVMLDMVPSLTIDINSKVEDLLFQINRPRTIEVDGQKIEINRLAKWSAAQLVQTIISIGPATTRVARTNLALLELDINSALNVDIPVGPNIPNDFHIPQPQMPTINASLQAALLDRLIEMAVEISEHGDRAE